MYKIYFDGHNLADYCIINNANPESKHDGGKIELKVDITIKDDVRHNIDMLNSILFTKDYKKLTVSSQPERYLMCKLVGDLKFSHWFKGSRTTLTFESDTHYWLTEYGDNEPPVFRLNEDGVIHVSNGGTASTYPEMAFKFPTDNGYLAIVAPNGFIELGKLDETDHVKLDTKYRVLYEEMHAEDMSDWEIVTDSSRLKGFLNQSIGQMSPSYDKNGLVLKTPDSPLKDKWNVFALTRKFDEHDHVPPADFNNFKFESRITMQDLSNGNKGKGDFRVMLTNENDDIVMGFSIGQYSVGKNETVAIAYWGDEDGTYKGFKSFIFPSGFSGYVRMIKEGDQFFWRFDSQRQQTVATVVQNEETFNLYNIVYLKNTATHYYHYNGTRYAIPSFVRGRKHWISGTRMFKGKRQYEISYVNTKIAWVYDFDLTKNASSVGNTQRENIKTGSQFHEYRLTDKKLAGRVATKMMLVGGVHANDFAPSGTNLSSIYIDRINNDVKFKDVKNTFKAGDVLTIDNKTNQILHNEAPYQGYIDPASRFFDIDFGQTDIQIVTSDWAKLPDGKLQIEERWR